ncbi:SRPBCC family protein [Alkaliflexus imshenetskii]|uniref:SRPBCC family protein n=1 Tax=Alkaliflexus imshenetskii TaxID=286730 RepID=UPI000479FCBC|nr:SRPBCC family protein [Alkaliflexus imshenetskii]
MTTFEGPIQTIPHSSDVVFSFLSDFNNFESLLPAGKVSGWESTGDTCRFNVEGIGEIGLRIVDKDAPKAIKYTADGKTPFNFFLWVQLKQVADADTRVKLTIKADLNPMLKMVVTAPVNKFLEVVTGAIASYPYQTTG